MQAARSAFFASLIAAAVKLALKSVANADATSSALAFRLSSTMKTLASTIFIFASLALTAPTGAVEPGAQHKTRPVKIYLQKLTDLQEPDNPYNLYPVTRQGSAAAPMYSALKALLAGPTAAEKLQGIVSSTYGVKLVSVRVRDGTAYTRFRQPPDSTIHSGSIPPFVFKYAVIRTAQQFPEVKEVIVCLDGLLNFGDESDNPPQRCPR